MSTVHDNIPVYDSKKEYASSLLDLSVPHCDPNHIDDMIKIKKEIYSKLKFQYLEQETKEKFLRLIIDNKPIYIEEAHLEKMVQENETLKKNLKEQKKGNEDLLQELINSSTEVAQGAKELMELSHSNLKLMTEILDMNDKITEITDLTNMREQEFNMDVNDLLIRKIDEYEREVAEVEAESEQLNDADFSQHISVLNSIPDLKKIIELKQAENETLESKIENQSEEMKAVRSLIGANEKKANELEQYKIEKNASLKELMETREQHMQLAENDSAHEQSDFVQMENLGKKLSKMIQLWKSIANHEIEFQDITPTKQSTDGDYIVVVKIGALNVRLKHFSDNRLRCFKILNIEKEGIDDENVSEIIEDCNMKEDCIAHYVKYYHL